MNDQTTTDRAVAHRCGAPGLIARWECRPDAHGRMRPVLVWGTQPAVLAQSAPARPRLVEVVAA
jgi:hypothetical protein